MGAVPFDTLEATEDLKAAGLEEAHARAIARTVHRAMSEGVATKEHVSAEIATLRAEMHALLLKTAVGIVIANVSITVALLKLLP